MFCFFKKSRRQLLSILFIAAIIFITIQFLIINNFNTTTIAILTDQTEPKNQNNVIINKILMNKMQTTSSDSSSNKYRAKRKSQFKIPLDSNNQPELVNLLPFYHRFNHFNNFSLYFIDDPAIMISTTAIKKSTFIGIESENRMIDLSLLKKDDIDLDHINLDNIKGINKMNKLLYKPDSDGYFKCLNSNVNYFFLPKLYNEC